MIRGIKHTDDENSPPTIKFNTPSGEFKPTNQINLELVVEPRSRMSSDLYFYGERL